MGGEYIKSKDSTISAKIGHVLAGLCTIILFIVVPISIVVSVIWYIDPVTGLGRALALVVALILAVIYEVVALLITAAILDN